MEHLTNVASALVAHVEKPKQPVHRKPAPGGHELKHKQSKFQVSQQKIQWTNTAEKSEGKDTQFRPAAHGCHQLSPSHPT